MLPIPDTQHNFQWAKALVATKPRTFGHIDELQTFTPMYSHGVDGQIVREMYKTLFKVNNRNAKSTLQALQSALLCLAQCAQFSSESVKYAFIHKRTTKAKRTISRYKDREYSDRNLTSVLDALADLGYVRYVPGFKGEGVPKGLATLWLVEDTFADWLTEHQGNLTLVAFCNDREELILKDKDGNLKEYDDDGLTQAMRSRIAAGNGLREQHAWSYIPLDRELWEAGQVSKGKVKKEYRQFVLDDERELMGVESLQCRRVFKGDFESGGRFYCSAQSLNKAERQTIQIDAETTFELDLKSLHPRLLYNLEGHEAPEDCYAADTKEDRALNKKACMYVLNCESRQKAVRGLISETGCSAEHSERTLQRFVDRHPLIATHFFKASWKSLQFLDSQLVDAVLSRAVEAGVPLLPVHDSFIGKTKDTVWLKDVISKCYKELTGFEPVVDWE